ncbi:hypothetical protein AVEN_43255-1 [Araneus ventricosus]|uniref:Uncharacterized protein n=1 Tax=Araneus ventricosus TaxID=182803 RepID=A0A4Y2GE15_ARAVE|nr:hypothetical protein AVEN_43255-1 [Araneus ventricosus]
MIKKLYEQRLETQLISSLPDLMTNVINAAERDAYNLRRTTIMLPGYGNHSRRNEWITGGWKLKFQTISTSVKYGMCHAHLFAWA